MALTPSRGVVRTSARVPELVLRPQPPASPRQRLPSVDRALGWPALTDLAACHGHARVLEAVRAELAEQRLQLLQLAWCGAQAGQAAS